MQHVFIVGSKGIPGNYGGYETFVDRLTEYHQNNEKIKYHVACIGDEEGEFEYHGARCFKLKVPDVGPGKAILYDLAAIKAGVSYCKAHPEIKDPIFYILACRIGPFMARYKRMIRSVGGTLYINPDGHEWLRAKWSAPVRRYWKVSENLMVKQADLLICDSKNIEKYIQTEYAKHRPNTTFIAYGADVNASPLSDEDEKLVGWYAEKGLTKNNYYLVVGRFVPENNYETMIKEFMKSSSKKDFAIITTANPSFLAELASRIHFENDARIKFVGTVYDKDLLQKIRENAYGYFHGHEVGGTNPSLLEALGSTKLNLLLDVGFNREVAEEAAVYWNKDDGNLASLIDEADGFEAERIETLGEAAKQRIKDAYSWEFISSEYEDAFLNKQKFGL